MYQYLTQSAIDNFISTALAEDIGDGDHTTLSTVPARAIGKAKLLVKGNGVLAGVKLAQRIFQIVDDRLSVEVLMNDGDKIKHGDIAFYVIGHDRSILTAERLVLNCMQRMSGIATVTNQMVEILKPYKTKVLDTRKTTPNFRMCEKWAVKIGGGVNHRFGLFDMILIKDNHVDYAGGIKKALYSAFEYNAETKKDLPVEIEVRTLLELEQVLEVGGVVRIMLDNFKDEDITSALKMINGRFPVEASGGISPTTIENYAKLGVDYVSMGYLTHSISSIDLSLKAIK